MSIHRKATLASMMILTLVAGCVAAESTPTPVRPTDTPVRPTDTPVRPTDTPVPPTDTPIPPTPTASSIPPTESPTPSPSPTVVSFEVTRNVPYITEEHSRQKLDIYLPASGDGPFPTLLLMHGGGGDKRDLDHWANYFVVRGYAAVSINYRDMTRHGYPEPVQDAFCALAWTHANADTYGFDPQRIFALGHSAGGTLAAMLGTVGDPALFTEDCPHQLPDEADWIHGAIPFTGIFDYASAAQSSSVLRSFLDTYLGADLDQAPEIWAQASATTWVDGSAAPFLLIHGAADKTIDPDQSVDFADVLEQAGVNVELLLIPDADHGAITRSEQSFEAVEDFLATLLAATPTPTPDGKQVLFIIQEYFNASEYGEPRTLLEERKENAIVASSSLDMVTAYGQVATAQPDILLSDEHAAD